MTLASPAFLAAQQAPLLLASAAAPASSSSALPDAPSFSAVQESTPQDSVPKTAETSRPVARATPRVANPYDMTVGPGQVGPPQTRRDQVISGIKDSISPFTFGGEIISAGYSHLTNGSPNYGTNAPAFGSRAGASFARGASQNIFSESILAPLLREDARYYQLGSSVPFFHRVVYAGTRPLITRTQSGHQTPNVSVLGGYLGAAYLTRTYNPVLNQSTTEVFKAYGTSLGGAALGYVVAEFLPDTLAFLHLNHERR